MPKIVEIGKANATFQVFLSLRDNRNKRHREGKFLVEGVKAINALLKNKWAIDSLLVKNGSTSDWCKDVIKDAGAVTLYKLSDELMAEISGKDGVSELIAIAKIPSLNPNRLSKAEGGVYVLLDRPNSPGNLGSTIRSAEAFGASGVLCYGHAADFFDPKCISASIGALFAIPLAMLDSPEGFKAWVAELGEGKFQVAALDENGDTNVWDIPRDKITVLVVGNETDGLSKVFKENADLKLRIPMRGSSTSLNAANSGSIILYELLSRKA